MTKTLTFDELREKLKGVQASVIPGVMRGMKKAALNVEKKAKQNCTPGKSPYWKAPYSDDKDPEREVPHMRDVMYAKVSTDGREVRAIVGNPKHYALFVHEGTAKMASRPFILDAIKEKEEETRKIISDALEVALLQCCEGDVFSSGRFDYAAQYVEDVGDESV